MVGCRADEANSQKRGQALNGATMPLANHIAYKTAKGIMLKGPAESILISPIAQKYRGKVQLIFTSPPFPLNRKKRYGNLQGKEYVKWLADFAPLFRNFLKKDGSIVMEMGNAWEPGKPVMSTLALEALLEFLSKGKFHLCQQFICYNPARLPSPAQWVNIERIRLKDSYTHIWWIAPSERPKADNRRVLKEYSSAMLHLLSSKKYNAGKRPSEHHIGTTSFLKNNKGAIPSNVLTFANTSATDEYLKYCRKRGLQLHPSRMPVGLPEFFIKFLTRPRNLVLDPFAGSNTTGAAAERLKRRYIRIETDANSNYNNPNDPALSRINIIVSGPGVLLHGSTPLQGGRMRGIFDGIPGANFDDTGIIRVELSCSGLPVLWDERTYRIVKTPLARPAERRVNLPPFDWCQVNGPEDQRWTDLNWPDDINSVASIAQMENGTLMIYYSTVFPKYASHRVAFERRDPNVAASFTKRYEIWLAVHSLLLYQDQQTAKAAVDQKLQIEEDPEIVDARDRQERCRIATLAALFAVREVQLPAMAVDVE
jgi:DNA modification methylase